MKDRASILMSGHASNAAYWIDHDSGQWVSSTYWMPDLPQWAKDFNAGKNVSAARTASGFATGSFYEDVGGTAAGVRYQLDFARALIAAEHLGHNPAGATDLLTLSISSTDIHGHAVGSEDATQRTLIAQSDRLLDAFFTYLDNTVGLSNVMIAMTGDHGAAVSQKSAASIRMPVLDFPSTSFIQPLEAMLEKKWPLKKKGAYVIQMDNPYLLLNRQAFEAVGVSEEEAENTTKAMLERVFATFASTTGGPAATRITEPAALIHAYTVKQMREGPLPDTQYSRLLAHSYSPYIGWALHLNFAPYQFTWIGSGTTHFTANSYDRHVPLELYGTAFIPGTYHGMVAPVDIAATFASLLRINRPSAAVGHVLTEAIDPAYDNPPRITIKSGR
jgi:hypothetical protein